jgi:Ca2+-binding EF-hand superfamily protein
MRAIGLEPSDAELHNMITEVDGSGSFMVTWPTLCCAVKCRDC